MRSIRSEDSHHEELFGRPYRLGPRAIHHRRDDGLLRSPVRVDEVLERDPYAPAVGNTKAGEVTSPASRPRG